MDISNSLTYHITKTGNILRQLSAKRLKEAGIDITPEESVLMNQLWDKQPQTISELGQWSVKDQSTVSRQIESLEKKGYVKRFHDQQDRRHVQVSLSSDGVALKSRFIQTGIPEMDNTLTEADIDTLQSALLLLRNIKEKALKELQR